MKPYLDLVRHILEHGEPRGDRTGTGTRSIFGAQVRYDLREGFPLITTKKVLFSAVVRELLWFLRGSTNIHDDLAKHTPIWNAWADDDGELGPIYGYQWRHWGKPWDRTPPTPREEGARSRDAGASGELLDPIDRRGSAGGEGIDQIAAAIARIKTDPMSRRIVVSAWNVGDLDRMALPPCHVMFQFYVAGDRLDCQLYQRSADMALAVRFNIASYALLLTMVAKECGLTPGFFVHTLGDAHIYQNHVTGLEEQLSREPYPLPRVRLADKPLDAIDFDDVELIGYRHHPFIKFDVAV